MKVDPKKKVAIYAAKTLRGQIIARSLALCGIDVSFDPQPAAAVARIEKGEAGLLLVDVNNHLQAEIELVGSLVRHLADSLLVTHTDPHDCATLQALGIDPENCIGGPLDPEQIYVAVEAYFAMGRRPGREARQLQGKRWRMGERGRRMRRRASKVFRRALWASGSRAGRWHMAIMRWLTALRPLRQFLLLAGLLAVGGISGYLFWCLSTLPDIDRLNHFSPFKTSRLYSYDNQLLAELYEQRRTPVTLKDVPPYVRNAFIAVEDARYFQHSGIDPIRIAGALWADIKAGEYRQGGSTITQQLSKMIFLKPEKTISRKIKEMAIAIQLERRYSKDRILELYLNQAYFGSQTYGIQSAAQAYFGKSVDRLNLAEGALLAALPKAPGAYSPFQNPERSQRRRDFVLERMYVNKLITQGEYQAATQSALPTLFNGRVFQSPYFVDFCKKHLEEAYGDRLATSGLTVYTTLDARLQFAAESAIQVGMDALADRGLVNVQAALVALSLDTGQIKAMVGGTNYARTQFNRATQALRQPGSAFKPIVYLTALQKGFQPDSRIQDLPVAVAINKGRQTWRPRNYTGRYSGEVTLKEALTRSLNAATVHLALEVGLKDIIETARLVGIQSKLHAVYPTVLGASEVTLIELVTAYGALATGRRVVPTCVDRIIDKEIATIWDSSKPPAVVLPPSEVAAIREMLASVVSDGTARRARSLGRMVYGKTGTTNGNADALFIGFDASLVVGVWVGRDDRSPIGPKETGARAALPIWVEFMKQVPTAAMRVASVNAR